MKSFKNGCVGGDGQRCVLIMFATEERLYNSPACQAHADRNQVKIDIKELEDFTSSAAWASVAFMVLVVKEEPEPQSVAQGSHPPPPKVWNSEVAKSQHQDGHAVSEVKK